MDQINMFQQMYKKLPKWNGKLKLGTFFSGIGAPEGALKDIGIDVDLQFFSEIDKYAIKGYCEIHNVDEELGVGSINDLKGIDLPYCDMWFGGFPCQDISLAGNGKGFDIESGSRSSLGWEMIRLASEVQEKPKYIVFENVAAIFNNTHRPILNLFKQDLEALGYTLYNKLLNAKHFGSPQNRNRYFLVAILGEYNYNFPKPIKLELRLKDLLEDEVDEKYYLKKEQLKQLIVTPHDKSSIGRVKNPEKDICNSIDTMTGGNREPKVFVLGNVNPSGKGMNGKVYSGNISPTITTNKGEGLKVLIPEATKKGYAEATDGDGIYLDRPHQKRGVVQKGMTPTIKTSGEDIGVVIYDDFNSKIKDDQEVIGTVTPNFGNSTPKNGTKLIIKGLKTGKLTQYWENIYVDEEDRAYILSEDGTLYRIRKLTPLECYRLQAFTDEDYNKAASVISNSQLYKTAGNSINRNVLKAIFTNLLKEETNEKDIK